MPGKVNAPETVNNAMPSAEEIQKALLKKSFDQIDTEQNGEITLKQLVEYIKTKGIKGLDAQKAEDFVATWKLDQAVKITFDQFGVLFKQITGQEVTKEEEEKYSILSKEAAEKLKEVSNDDLKELNLEAQQLVELKTAFDAIDVDGNGGITFEELVAYSK